MRDKEEGRKKSRTIEKERDGIKVNREKGKEKTESESAGVSQEPEAEPLRCKQL